MPIFALVILSGLLFSLGDVVAREWSATGFSPLWFMIMAGVGTSAYTSAGVLMRYAEFSKVAIWVSIALTCFSCLYGVAVLGDTLTTAKMVALVLALVAAYLSVF